MAQLPVVTGVTARYQGLGNSNFTTTFYYWVQAIYPAGVAQLSASANTGAFCPAQLTTDNLVNVQWQPAPGAIGYFVYRSTSSTLPGFGATAVFVATSETGFSDNGNFPTFTKTPKYDGLYMWRAVYDFATDGGVVGAIIPALSDSIPANAILVGGVANPTIAPTGTSGATIAIGTSAGSAANSILAATAIATFSIDAVLELLGVNSQAATNKASFKMSAAGQLQITVATHPLTAGRIEIFVWGVIADNA